MDDPRKTGRARTPEERAMTATEPGAAMASMSVEQLKQMSKGALAREIVRLNALLNRMDLAALVAQARRTPFRNSTAFKVLTYRSPGGTEEKRIWNSRDGVVPFTIHVDGMAYDHVLAEDEGPYFDRPEGIIGQWETRTEAKMMEAWHRVLERAVLAGRMQKAKATAAADDPVQARKYGLDIGLRSMATGRYTDEAP